jgi:hypothetical protein
MTYRMLFHVATCAFLLGLGQSVSADDKPLRFAGYSSESYAGDQIDYFLGHQVCDMEYHGVWCTSKMIVENGFHPHASLPVGLAAWVNPYIVTQDSVGTVDFSGSRARDTTDLNCSGWDAGDVDFEGLVLYNGGPNGGGYKIINLVCSEPQRVACCSTVAPPHIVTPVRPLP